MNIILGTNVQVLFFISESNSDFMASIKNLLCLAVLIIFEIRVDFIKFYTYFGFGFEIPTFHLVIIVCMLVMFSRNIIVRLLTKSLLDKVDLSLDCVLFVNSILLYPMQVSVFSESFLLFSNILLLEGTSSIRSQVNCYCSNSFHHCGKNIFISERSVAFNVIFTSISKMPYVTRYHKNP